MAKKTENKKVFVELVLGKDKSVVEVQAFVGCRRTATGARQVVGGKEVAVFYPGEFIELDADTAIQLAKIVVRSTMPAASEMDAARRDHAIQSLQIAAHIVKASV